MLFVGGGFDEDKLVSKKRVIVFSICLDTELLNTENENTRILDVIHDAIIQFYNKLRPDDYICFNIGNEDQLLDNDKQRNLKTW